MTKYTKFADSLGYIGIFPSAINDTHCFDVNTARSLSHNGGGDSETLVRMVNYTIAKYNADPKQIFVTGSSSGGMMTNVLCSVYPETFAAGSVYSGVAAGCLADEGGSSPISSNRHCSDGLVTKTSAEWVSQVNKMDPGYKGKYPKMQIWHGTADALVLYHSLGEEIKQWEGLQKVSWTKNNTNVPANKYTQMIFGDGSKLVAYSAVGVGHTVPVHEESDLKWFGLEK
jgi:acetylxylan esterase